jgi:hypothetical protein
MISSCVLLTRKTVLVVLANDMRMSCRPSCPRAHRLTFRSALEEPAARAELRACPACRLHARVRRRLARWLNCASHPRSRALAQGPPVRTPRRQPRRPRRSRLI